MGATGHGGGMLITTVVELVRREPSSSVTLPLIRRDFPPHDKETKPDVVASEAVEGDFTAVCAVPRPHFIA